MNQMVDYVVEQRAAGWGMSVWT